MEHIEFIPATTDYFIQQRDKMKSEKIPFITCFTAGQLIDCRLYVSYDYDSKIGYGIQHDNELFSLFNNSGIQGLGKHAIIDAIEKGADNLFCFEGHLSALYSQFGFVITDLQAFDDKYAPKNWNYKKYGQPNVVWMKLK